MKWVEKAGGIWEAKVSPFVFFITREYGRGYEVTFGKKGGGETPQLVGHRKKLRAAKVLAKARALYLTDTDANDAGDAGDASGDEGEKSSRFNPAGVVDWMKEHPWMTFFLGLGVIGIPAAVVAASKKAAAPQLPSNNGGSGGGGNGIINVPLCPPGQYRDSHGYCQDIAPTSPSSVVITYPDAKNASASVAANGTVVLDMTMFSPQGGAGLTPYGTYGVVLQSVSGGIYTFKATASGVAMLYDAANVAVANVKVTV